MKIQYFLNIKVVDNNFEICAKLSNEEIIKIITDKELEKIIDFRDDYVVQMMRLPPSLKVLIRNW